MFMLVIRDKTRKRETKCVRQKQRERESGRREKGRKYVKWRVEDRWKERRKKKKNKRHNGEQGKKIILLKSN
jgi:hypothetical protein